MNRLLFSCVVCLAVGALALPVYAQNNFNQIVIGLSPNTATLTPPSGASGTFTFPTGSGSFQILSTGGGQTVSGTLTATVNNQVLAGLRLAPTYTDGAFTGVSHASLALGTASSAGTAYFSDGTATPNYGILKTATLSANQTYTLPPTGGSIVTTDAAFSGTQMWNAGDLLYSSAAGNTVSRLPIGSHANGEIMTIVSGSPQWATVGATNAASIFVGQTTSNLDNAATDYLMPMGQTAGNNHTLSFKLSEVRVTRSGTIRNLYVDLTVAPSAGNSRTFTITKIVGGVESSSMANGVTISGTATSGSNTTDSFSVSAGDIIVVKHTPTSSPSNSEAVWSFELQ